MTFLVILLLKVVPWYRAEVLSGVPEHEKAVMCGMEKMRVLRKLCSGVSYRALGHELNVNESTIYYIECL